MNKRINTLLFIIGATLFNIIVIIACFFLFSFLYDRFIVSHLSNPDGSWVFNIILLSSIMVSFSAYRTLFKFLQKKIDIEKYFSPIFAGKYRKN
jgi:hypothetical protein